MDDYFQSKTVIVTGASAGVGKATVDMFLEAGANVVLVARRLAPLEEAAAGRSRTLVIAADVSETEAMARVVEETVATFGGLHGVVNNAGAHFRGKLRDNDEEHLATMVDVNLRGPIVLTRLALPHLERDGGFVVNVASLAGKVPLDGAATYSATKFGLRAFSYAMAFELEGTGVTVSVVSPGPIETGFILDDIDTVADISFSQEMCTAEDVATMIVSCARDGRLEREFPVVGGKLATLSYLIPGLRQKVKPLLERKGRRVKERLKKERKDS